MLIHLKMDELRWQDVLIHLKMDELAQKMLIHPLHPSSIAVQRTQIGPTPQIRLPYLLKSNLGGHHIWGVTSGGSHLGAVCFPPCTWGRTAGIALSVLNINGFG
jgi:hypothetical protein